MAQVTREAERAARGSWVSVIGVVGEQPVRYADVLVGHETQPHDPPATGRKPGRIMFDMLRDTISSHAGLQEAIAITSRVAPAPIRSEVQTLSVRAAQGSLTDALRRFAADVEDPVADLVVAALVIAADRQAQRLPELLTQISLSAREQAAMRRRVETGRARTYASSKALVVITFGLAVVLMLFSPTFMRPYDTATGQLVLVGIGALFAGALWGLVQLGRPADSPRLLSGIQDGVSR